MEKLSRVRQVFLDMDGTIYKGNHLFPTTVPFLDFLRERGIAWTFLSNNSSYSAAEYASKLKRLGIAAEPEDFYTSTEYAIDYLRHHHPEIRKIFLLGMASIVPAFREAGFAPDDAEPEAVVIAFDRSLTYEKLCRAAYFLRRGVPGFATHPDVFCPTDQETWLVDCGAITKALEVSTGKTLKVLGKPDPGMLRAAAARHGVLPGECLMIGDRLSTDIALGVNAGALTCRILSADSEHTDVPGIVPDYAVRDLGELQEIWMKRK